MPPVIEIRNLDFSYNRIPVLEGINLEIQAEEFFGLIGPNAAGKSTLIRLLLGLLQPDRGSITIRGKDPVLARDSTGYVPQHPTFARSFPVTVREVVMMGNLASSSPAGWFTEDDQDRTNYAMHAVEIDNIADRPISGISGGQLQRMLIARALVSKPEILILDEPTSNIDLQAEENIFSLLKHYNEHMTIIVVSHDVAFISDYVHRVGCLNRTLVCHETGSISGKTIEELYGTAVRMIDHSH